MKNKFLESRWLLQSNEPSMLMETRPHFTHLEMSPLSMKGCIFWPMLGTYGHWAVRVLYSLPHLLRHGSSPRIHDIYTYSRLFGCGAVKTCFNDLGLSRLGLNSQPYACGANTINHCTTAALYTKHFEQKHVWTNFIPLQWKRPTLIWKSILKSQLHWYVMHICVPFTSLNYFSMFHI